MVNPEDISRLKSHLFLWESSRDLAEKAKATHLRERAEAVSVLGQLCLDTRNQLLQLGVLPDVLVYEEERRAFFRRNTKLPKVALHGWGFPPLADRANRRVDYVANNKPAIRMLQTSRLVLDLEGGLATHSRTIPMPDYGPEVKGWENVDRLKLESISLQSAEEAVVGLAALIDNTVPKIT